MRMASKMAAQRGQVGQEQEVPVELLGRASDLECRLDAEDVIAVVAEIEVGGGEDRAGLVDDEAGHRRHEHHPHEID